MDGDYPTSQCADPRCDRPVVIVRLLPNLVETPVDPAPVAWPDGTIRIRGGWSNGPPIAYPLRKTLDVGAAFAATELRQLHAETCKGKQRHKRQRATSS